MTHASSLDLIHFMTSLRQKSGVCCCRLLSCWHLSSVVEFDTLAKDAR